MAFTIPSYSKNGRFWRRGEPFVWMTGAALAATLTLTFALLVVVLSNGLGVFWPATIVEIELNDGSKLLGEALQTETNPENGIESIKFHIGNREDGPAFRWIEKNSIKSIARPQNALVLERNSDLQGIGLFKRIIVADTMPSSTESASEQLSLALAKVRKQYGREIEPLVKRQQAISSELKDRLKYTLLRLNYERDQLTTHENDSNSKRIAELSVKIKELQAAETRLRNESDRISSERSKLESKLHQNQLVLLTGEGHEKSIPLLNIVRYYFPNQMGLGAKIGHYLAKVWELIASDPRESNQDGGLFPAIFGTMLMVFLMAVTCFPLGVLAGIYLGEYAKEGVLVKMVRIAVNNLAGIPSIVYGIFGMGFFIYLLGGSLDRWLFPERLTASINEPVFGQGCIFWASLTLGLLTIPVVIVSTEEALRAIPRGIREGSYALGATKFQTLVRVLFPMASPGMMTGFILAMARAAGEVAPLMLTGALKIAPVPLDGSFPYLHLDQKFMHLGYHILDLSCNSPNIEATKPMVYVTTLLLLVLVLSMSSTAIYLRNRMRKRYMMKSL